MDDLLRAQKRLGRTLERASIGEDRQLATAVREKGEGFSNLFFSLVRMTRIYELNNESFRRPIEELIGLLRWLLDSLGVVRLVTVEDQVYINDIRIRFKAAGSPTQQMGRELRKHNVGSVTFHQSLEHDQLLILFGALGGPPAETQPRTAVNQVLAGESISAVELGGEGRHLEGRLGAEDLRGDGVLELRRLALFDPFTQSLVRLITSGQHFSTNQHLVADSQLPHDCIV